MPKGSSIAVHSDAQHPPFDAITPQTIEAQMDQAIAAHRTAIEAICASNARDFDGVLLAREAAEVGLRHWWNPVSHLSRVADSPALRQTYAKAEELLAAHRLWVAQNHALCEATAAAFPADGLPEWTTEKHRLRTLALRDFKLGGVALAPAERERYREIAIELTKLTTAFSNAVLDSTEAFHLDLFDASRLAGISDREVERFRTSASAAGREGYRIGLHAPDVQAVLTYAHSRRLRRDIYRAYATRASDQEAGAGRFDNSDRIERIMALRHEAALLLGFSSSADHSLATKMATGPDAVDAFLVGLAGRARAAALSEVGVLEQTAAALGIKQLRPWDVDYVSEHLRRETLEFDAEAIRAYFPVGQVIDGTMDLLGALFGIRFSERHDVPLWHEDARYYDIFDADGGPIGGVYLDLFARAGKRGGAWMEVCRQRFVDGGRTELPVAFLTCNFAGPSGKAGATLRHGDVVTFLHEFGHVLHHVLTEVDYPSIGGISGVEWDAVELPSQLMENFAWDYPALTRLSRHIESGTPLPRDLFERLRAVRTFQSGMRLCRQIELALFDLRLHRDYDPSRGACALAILAQVRREVAVVHPPRWHRLPHSFTHIFAGGYAAGYYSYLWAELLSADAFARFRAAEGIFAVTGAAFRDEVLARGASRPAAENFVAFRGREPDARALLLSYGLET